MKKSKFKLLSAQEFFHYVLENGKVEAHSLEDEQNPNSAYCKQWLKALVVQHISPWEWWSKNGKVEREYFYEVESFSENEFVNEFPGIFAIPIA